MAVLNDIGGVLFDLDGTLVDTAPDMVAVLRELQIDVESEDGETIRVRLIGVYAPELAMAGAHGGAIGYVVKNALWHIFEQGAGGIVIGVIYGRRISSGSGLS